MARQSGRFRCNARLLDFELRVSGARDCRGMALPQESRDDAADCIHCGAHCVADAATNCRAPLRHGLLSGDFGAWSDRANRASKGWRLRQPRKSDIGSCRIVIDRIRTLKLVGCLVEEIERPCGSETRPDGVLRYWFCFSAAVASCSSSAFCQVAFGLYSAMVLAMTPVFLPRSF